MKHPKYKGIGFLDAEIRKLERDVVTKEIEFELVVKKLKNAEPYDDIRKLRNTLKSKEKSVIKAKRQVKSKIAQKTRKEAERNNKRFGGKVQKRKNIALNQSLNEELKIQGNILSQLKNMPISFAKDLTKQNGKESDLFISHASEDKADFVKSLADELINQGVSVWYDEYALRIGDSLRKSIDKGLSQSRFGLIILSKSFFEKNWTQYELNGLVAKEMEGEKVILPIWHNISKDEILKLSPSLVDKFALNSATNTVQEIAEKVADAVNNA